MIYTKSYGLEVRRNKPMYNIEVMDRSELLEIINDGTKPLHIMRAASDRLMELEYEEGADISERPTQLGSYISPNNKVIMTTRHPWKYGQRERFWPIATFKEN